MARRPRARRHHDRPGAELAVVERHVDRPAAECETSDGRPLAELDAPVERGAQQGGMGPVRPHESAVRLVHGGLAGLEPKGPAAGDLFRREHLVPHAARGECARSGGRGRP